MTEHSAFKVYEGSKYEVGETVKVKYLFPPSGHIRAPFYLRGKIGKIIRFYGIYPDPTELADGIGSPAKLGLYQLSFCYYDVWDENLKNQSINDMKNIYIFADIYENWLLKDGN